MSPSWRSVTLLYPFFKTRLAKNLFFYVKVSRTNHFVFLGGDSWYAFKKVPEHVVVVNSKSDPPTCWKMSLVWNVLIRSRSVQLGSFSPRVQLRASQKIQKVPCEFPFSCRGHRVVQSGLIQEKRNWFWTLFEGPGEGLTDTDFTNLKVWGWMCQFRANIQTEITNLRYANTKIQQSEFFFSVWKYDCALRTFHWNPDKLKHDQTSKSSFRQRSKRINKRTTRRGSALDHPESSEADQVVPAWTQPRKKINQGVF